MVADVQSNDRSSGPKWRRRFFLLVVAWCVVTVATSFAPVRGFLIAPLHIHESDASGSFAYVMADGPATWERLRAAADLYHLRRINTIYLLDEQNPAGWNFVRKQLDSRLQREIDYLVLFGVPADRIVAVPRTSETWMSSLAEAKSVAALIPDVRRLVVVTSPPHTRRSKLCFLRVYPAGTRVFSYAPDDPANSTETHFPIWIEYAKLMVYWCCA